MTQDLRLALDAPRVLTEAVQDRLVANGGALGEWVPSSPAAGAVISKGPVTQPSYAFGNANVWARGYDQFGSASASTSIGAVGYGINRAAPLIGGIDWRLGNNIVTGVATTYVASSASFKDGSRTNLSSYQGAIYAGWAAGPWYALGSAVVSFNDFGTSRLSRLSASPAMRPRSRPDRAIKATRRRATIGCFPRAARASASRLTRRSIT